MNIIVDKRGLELAINTIVILVLALVLLVVIIMFFTETSTGFFDKTKSYFSYSNIGNVVNGCSIFADTENKYSFCCEKKTVKYFENDRKIEEKLTCNELSKLEIGKEIKKLNCEIVC